LVTKAIAAGALLLAALYVAAGHAESQVAVGVMPALVAGAFTGLTALLLVADLKQPRRFVYLVTRPNWSSWLVRGAVVLSAYALVTAAWLLAGLTSSSGALQMLALPGAFAAAAAAGYTAFLFAQCEGRDLWQSPLLLPDLLAQAAIAGAAAFGLADLVLDMPAPDLLRWTLVASVVAHLALLTTDVSHHRRSEQAALAARVMTRGPEARRFWSGVGAALVAIALGALALAGAASGLCTALAATAALVSIVLAEAAFVRAGQAVPLS
jgi:formate-dependent nitrite reductase membrane component NrfD